MTRNLRGARTRSATSFRAQFRSLRAQVKGMTPEDAFASYVMLAWTLQENGLLDAALAVVNAAFEEFNSADVQGRADAFNLRGQVLQKLGRLDEARAAHEAMARLGRESSNGDIEAAALLALGSVAQKCGDATSARKHYVEALRLLQNSSDSRAIAQTLLNLVVLRIDAGELVEADELLSSIRPAIELYDVPLRAGCYGVLGNLRAAQKKYAEAAAAYHKALHAARRAQDRGLILKSYQNLGAVHLDLGLPKQSLRWYRKGAEMAQTAGSVAQRVALERGMAMAAHVGGDNQTASASLRSVIQIARRGADTAHEAARAAVDLAGIALKDGNTKVATNLLRKAHRDLRFDRDGPWVEGLWSNELAAAARSDSPGKQIDATLAAAMREIPASETTTRGKILRIAAEELVKLRAFARAKDLLATAVEVERNVRDRRGTAWANAQAGALLLSAGGAGEAEPFFTRAAQLYSRVGDNQMLFQCLNDSANALTEAGDYAAALRRYEKSLALARRLRDRAMVAQTSLNRAEALRRRRTPVEALPAIRQAVRVYQALGDGSGHANATGTLALVLADLGRDTDAERAFRQSAVTARKAGDNRSLAVALGGMAGLARERQQFSKAITLYRQAIALERTANDPSHECESQAGLLVALAGQAEETGWRRTADRVLHLANLIRRPELATWAFTEGGAAALRSGHSALAAKLFALSLGVPFNGGLREDALIEAATQQAIAVVLRLLSDDGDRIQVLASKVTAAAERLGGKTFGRLVRIMMEAGVKAARQSQLPAPKRGPRAAVQNR